MGLWIQTRTGGEGDDGCVDSGSVKGGSSDEVNSGGRQFEGIKEIEKAEIGFFSLSTYSIERQGTLRSLSCAVASESLSLRAWTGTGEMSLLWQVHAVTVPPHAVVCNSECCDSCCWYSNFCCAKTRHLNSCCHHEKDVGMEPSAYCMTETQRRST